MTPEQIHLAASHRAWNAVANNVRARQEADMLACNKTLVGVWNGFYNEKVRSMLFMYKPNRKEFYDAYPASPLVFGFGVTPA